jgi:hypothetical protein
VGYGFGIWNKGSIGEVGKLPYDYATISYLYEKNLTPRLAVVLEPFCNVINSPRSGIDAGLIAHLKTYFTELGPQKRFYFAAGAGTAYTTMKFKGQGTHGLFVLQGTIGYRHGSFFIEDRFHHYSNGWPGRTESFSQFKYGENRILFLSLSKSKQRRQWNFINTFRYAADNR